MAVKDISISTGDELVVKTSSGAAAAPGTIIPPSGVSKEALDRANQVAEAFRTSLNQAAVAAAAAAETQAGGVPSGAGGVAWDVATAGPFLLFDPALPPQIKVTPPNPPFRPNKVIPEGALVVFYGIQYYLNNSSSFAMLAKKFNARFSTINLTNVTPGPSVVNSAVTDVAFGTASPLIEPFQLFFMVAPPVKPGNDAELFELHYTMDFDVAPSASSAGFAEYDYDPDSTFAGPFGIPPQAPGTWRRDCKFLVFKR